MCLLDLHLTYPAARLLGRSTPVHLGPFQQCVGVVFDVLGSVFDVLGCVEMCWGMFLICWDVFWMCL